MRALKSKASDYFTKKQKPKEDPEARTNELEAKIIAKFIGIDERQLPSYKNFFQQIVKIKLPKTMKRHISADKASINYVNEQTAEEWGMHPLIDSIKSAFYRVLAETNAVYTFQAKSSKLLPFVEEKMMKQCIGLSSKRREAEKANLGKDENGKLVMSKLARIKPDIKGLISARSYMLKALVEKIYTRRELWGKGRKASLYAAVLAAERNHPGGQQFGDEQEDTEESLQLYEEIYEESKHYYQRFYGMLAFIPEQLKATTGYLRSTPQSVLRNITILNIDKENVELYWLARLMEALPLPPCWMLRAGDSFDQFYYEPRKLHFDIHPSYIYILQVLSQFKNEYAGLDVIHQNYYNNMKDMVFYDFFQRPYNVNLYALVERTKELPLSKRKLIKKSEELGRSDWMAVEAVKTAELSIPNYVLIDSLMEYWGTLNYKQDPYSPAISPFGEVIWSSNINQRTISYCPHREILKTIVKSKELDLPRVQDQDLKSQEHFPYFAEHYPRISEERENFLKHYIRNDPKPLSTPYQIQLQMNQHEAAEYFDYVFTSPFDLEADLHFDDEDRPIWLQKVAAKRNAEYFISLLKFNTRSFEQVRREFCEHALAITRSNYPSKQADILAKIDTIGNEQELVAFIRLINDVEAREAAKNQEPPLQQSESSEEIIEQPEVSEISDRPDDRTEGSEGLKEIEEQLDIDIKNALIELFTTPHPEGLPRVKKATIDEEPGQQQQDQARQPEAYSGRVISQNELLSRMGSSELNEEIVKLAKHKILKHKYSRSSIKDLVNQISDELLRNQNNDNEFLNRKRNILASNFTSEHYPYKISPAKIRRQPRRITTGKDTNNNSDEMKPFWSENSEVEPKEIYEIIRKHQQTEANARMQQHELQEKRRLADETKESIELQPLKRLKPYIQQDPVLSHISQVKDINDFRRTFGSALNKKSSKEETAGANPEKPFANTIKRTLSSGKVANSPWERLESAPVLKTDRTNKMTKSVSVAGISSNSVSPSKLNAKFNRVCLGATATSLLASQAIVKKGDLLLIQAKKSLLSKGRGLDTILARKY